ncbi:MAG: HXXEE domain-containing protein [Acidobacteriota bacterium]|nr:HXXEE domain-containing protein [Acidobacteriota bacterium]
MSDELESILVGTIGLDIIALVALALTVARGSGGSKERARPDVVQLGVLTLALQSIHFAEELATDFHQRFPALRGLHPWSAESFATLNLSWIAVWILSIVGVRRGFHAALFPVWFLGLASAVNSIAHPVMSIRAAGYFPGLWTAIPVGVAGAVLLRNLNRLTESRAANRGAA